MLRYINIGLLLGGLGVAVPQIYWTIAVAMTIFIVILSILSLIGTGKMPLLGGGVGLITAVVVNIVFPNFELSQFAWTYFLLLFVVDLFISMISRNA